MLSGLFLTSGFESIDSQTGLDWAIASAINSDPTLGVYVVGHTDNQGSFDYNMDLSERRATSVVNALQHDHGVEQARMKAVGAGPIAPVSSNDTEEGRRQNRRIDIGFRMPDLEVGEQEAIYTPTTRANKEVDK